MHTMIGFLLLMRVVWCNSYAIFRIGRIFPTAGNRDSKINIKYKNLLAFGKTAKTKVHDMMMEEKYSWKLHMLPKLKCQISAYYYRQSFKASRSLTRVSKRLSQLKLIKMTVPAVKISRPFLLMFFFQSVTCIYIWEMLYCMRVTVVQWMYNWGTMR